MTASPMVEICTALHARQRVLVGLVGRGIQLSRTPSMHEVEGSAHKLAYIYQLLDTDLMPGRTGKHASNLADILVYAEFFGFNGLNITFPYKQEVIALLDELSEVAKAVGSVNTVVLRDGRRFGHNTDMWGFKQSFELQIGNARRDRVLLLGAGGAGAAVAYALLDSGAPHLLISDVDDTKSEALAGRLASRFGSGRVSATRDLAAAADGADGIVNATPVGMSKLPGLPLDPALLRASCWVADIIYFPLETELLAEARKRGCRTFNGEAMAIHQAARAFELFTGKKPDTDRMRATFTAHRGGSDE